MSIRLPLTSEVEARLREQARAAGKDVSTFIIEALEEKLAREASANETNGPTAIPPAQRIAELRAWAASHADLPYEADDDREHIYEDRVE